MPGLRLSSLLKRASRDDAGCMVALVPDEPFRGVDEPARKQHLTLAYLGKAKDLTAAQHAALRTIATAHAASIPPLAGTVQGKTGFAEGARVALVSAPGLGEHRARLVAHLKAAGLPVSEKFDFTPHVTYSYENDEPSPAPGTPVRFSRLAVAAGGRWHVVPLGVRKGLGSGPGWSTPGGGGLTGAPNGAGWNEGAHPRGYHGKFTFVAAPQGSGVAHILEAAANATGRLVPGTAVRVTGPHGTISARLHSVTPRRISLLTPNGLRHFAVQSGRVNGQAVAAWDRSGRGAPPRPVSDSTPTGKVKKELGGTAGSATADAVGGTMTTEDFNHPGQAPLTVQQGRSERQCPRCGRPMSGGVCEVHGVQVRKWSSAHYVQDPEPAPPAPHGSGPALAAPRGRRRAKPRGPSNEPAGPASCPDCGGTDGYHAPGCTRADLDPGMTMDGAGQVSV